MRNGKRKIRIRPHAPLLPEEEIQPPKPLGLGPEKREPMCENCAHWSAKDRSTSVMGACEQTESERYNANTMQTHSCSGHEFMYGEYSQYDRRPEHRTSLACCRFCVFWDPRGDRAETHVGVCGNSDSAAFNHPTKPTTVCQVFTRREPEPEPSPDNPALGTISAPMCRVCVYWIPNGSRAEAANGQCGNPHCRPVGRTTFPTTWCQMFHRYNEEVHADEEVRNCSDCFHCFPETEHGERACHETASGYYGSVRGAGNAACPYFDEDREWFV